MSEDQGPLEFIAKQTGPLCWRLMSKQRWTSREDAEANNPIRPPTVESRKEVKE